MAIQAAHREQNTSGVIYEHGPPVGFQNSASTLDLVLYAARSYSLMRPTRTAR